MTHAVPLVGELLRPQATLEHVGTILPDDLVSRLVVADLDGRRLTNHELGWMLLLLLLGGNETSTALLTNLVWRLLEVPERWEAVNANPGLIDAAIEESLRYDPPALGLFRTTTRDVVRHGVTIRSPLNLPAQMAEHASQLYARNIQELLGLVIKDGEDGAPASLELDFEDEVVAGSCITRGGEVLHPGAKAALDAA